jgi:hypothetical protein
MAGMKRPAYDQTSLMECKKCSAPLDKNKLKGNLCMCCHYQETKKRRRAKRKAAIEHLGGKCIDCGHKYPEAVYDFHHIDPTQKDGHVSVLIGSNVKLERILNEASKCELLCSNCHRMRHFEE